MTRNVERARLGAAVATGSALLALSLACARGERTREPAEASAASPSPIVVDSARPYSPPGLAAERFPAPERGVASIVSAAWADEDSRDRKEEGARVLALLGVRPGMQVADIGAGSGYYVARASHLVGPSGRVYAEDIVPEYLRDLRERVAREHLGNVTLVLGDPHDARLPAASVDVALLVHVYHEIEQPFGLMYNLAGSLRPGGRVAVLDLERPTTQHGTPRRLLACELVAVGYAAGPVHDLGESGYLAVFTLPGAPTAPDSIAARVRGCRRR